MSQKRSLSFRKTNLKGRKRIKLEDARVIRANVKNMGKFLNLPPSNSKEIFKIIRNTEQKGTYESIDKSLEKINILLHGYGIEIIQAMGADHPYYKDIIAKYVNKGETYTKTIFFDIEHNKFTIDSLGDFAEFSSHGRQGHIL
jgi:hypothetical protein